MKAGQRPLIHCSKPKPKSNKPTNPQVGVVWLACWSLAEAQQQQQQRRRNGGFRPAFFDDDDDFGPREPFEDPAAPAVRRPVREPQPQQQRQVLRSGRPRQEAAVDFRPRQEPSDFRARPQAPPQAPPLPLVKSQKSKNRPAKRPLAALPQPAALQQQQPQVTIQDCSSQAKDDDGLSR